MEGVEAQEGRLAERVATDQQLREAVAEERDVLHEVRADSDRPVAELVPRQQVTGEREEEGQQQEDDADHPVELAGLLVRPGKEGAHHVEEHGEHHEMGRPTVDVAHELPEADAGAEVLHVSVGRADRGRVEEHQVHAGEHEDEEQHRDDEPQPERVAQSQHSRRDLHRVEVEEEVGERLQRPPAWSVDVGVAEHRSPRVAALDSRRDAGAGRVGLAGFEGVASWGFGAVGAVAGNRRRLHVSHWSTPSRAPSTTPQEGTG